MTENVQDNAYTSTVPALLLWPALIIPKAYQENGVEKGAPKFGGSFLFAADHPDLRGAKEKAAFVARAMWPGCSLKQATKAAPLDGIWWPFQSGSEYAAASRSKGKSGPNVDLFDGKAILKARSKYAPTVAWLDHGKVVELESTACGPHSAKLFSGAEACIVVNFKAGVVDEKKFVTAYLQKVFLTGKGTRIGGGKSAAEAFKGYIGSATPEDPTAGELGDEIAF